jgi:DNA-binding transcriptional ArsR family regulator
MAAKNDFKLQILDELDESPLGLTITEISAKTGIHRNTVSKYVIVLEAEGLVNKKEVSRSKLFFSKKRKYLPRKLVGSFMKALFSALKDKVPDRKEDFKEIGRAILENFKFPLGEEIVNEFERLRTDYGPQAKLQFFQEFYDSFDLFQDNPDVLIIELQEKRVIYKIKNPEFLRPPGNSTYFFYLACGIAEGLYKKLLKTIVSCNVLEIHVSNNIEESYVKILLELL